MLKKSAFFAINNSGIIPDAGPAVNIKLAIKPHLHKIRFWVSIEFSES